MGIGTAARTVRPQQPWVNVETASKISHPPSTTVLVLASPGRWTAETEIGVAEVQAMTQWDLALLERHLAFYQALATGRREPSTALQAHFVAAALGHVLPATQHEVAFSRYRNGWSDPRIRLVPSDSRSGLRPTDRIERTVDWIETARLANTSTPDSLIRIQGLYTRGRAQARRASADAATWIAATLSEPGLGKGLASWTSAEFGQLSDIYTKAIDGTYVQSGLVVGQEYVSPWLHRLFEGHDVLSAWRAVSNALPDDGLTDEALGYLRGLGSDLATQVGLPLATLSPDQFEVLKNALCDQLGLSREWLIDALQFNAVEVAAAAVPLAAAAMGWGRRDAETFARLAGGLGIGAVVAANPFAALVAVALLAKAFDGTLSGREFLGAVGSGGLKATAVLGAGAVLGGPAWLGVVGGIAVAAGIR
jgi:uncharacterized protein YifE (UPF0438 family)